MKTIIGCAERSAGLGNGIQVIADSLVDHINYYGQWIQTVSAIQIAQGYKAIQVLTDISKHLRDGNTIWMVLRSMYTTSSGNSLSRSWEQTREITDSSSITPKRRGMAHLIGWSLWTTFGPSCLSAPPHLNSERRLRSTGIVAYAH
ncbi:hypothetical protein BDV12DRAFT_204885 [Aspergillus spectabilis]